MPKKSTPARPKLTSKNPQEELLACLHAHAPEVFTEGRVDVQKLKESLGDVVDESNERYGLSWAGKAECFRHIKDLTTATLNPARDESVDFDTTGNIFIEGDNLQALKAIQGTYYGKIKMIYIDPPYNTGHDFVYNDTFAQHKKDYLKKIGAIDEDGYVVNADLFRQNTRDSGHFHSNWLNMMYPRLYLARTLLRQDGVIFVSIDDNEVKNLRAMMDEIFGEENFVAQIVWQNLDTIKNDAKYFSDNHEYILCYAKNLEQLKIFGAKRTDEKNKVYKNPDNDPRGVYLLTPLHAKSGTEQGRYEYAFQGGQRWQAPPGTFPRFSVETLRRLEKENRIYFGKNGKGVPQKKTFLSDMSGWTKLTTFWSYDFAGSTRRSNEELSHLIEKGIFQNPKPTSLVKLLVTAVTEKDDGDLILDFFSGSGTTAHGIMQLNAEDGGNRKCISIQLAEKCKPDTEAAKAGYITVADIAKERIRRAGKKIREEYKEAKGLDTGFRIFKLAESNLKIWDGNVANTEELQRNIEDFLQNVQPWAKEEDLMYELLLKYSKAPLTVAVERKKVGKAAYCRLGDGETLICVGTATQELCDAMIVEKPKKIIVLDRCFQDNDVLLTNFQVHARDAKIERVEVV